MADENAAPKPTKKPRPPFLLTPLGISILLAAAGILGCFAANLIHKGIIVGIIRWFDTPANAPTNTDSLLALASVAIVAWTGALIALQLRGISIELSGALFLLEYAFISPLVALAFQPQLLRPAATLGSLYFLSIIIQRVLLLIVLHIARRKASAEEMSFLGTEFGSNIMDIVARVVGFFPLFYVFVCLAASLITCVWPTHYSVAICGIVVLCIGLNFVISALNSDRQPLTPQKKATLGKSITRLSTMFEKMKAASLARQARGQTSAEATPLEATEHDKSTSKAPLTEDERRKLKEHLNMLAHNLSEGAEILRRLDSGDVKPQEVDEHKIDHFWAVLGRLKRRQPGELGQDYDEAIIPGLEEILDRIDPNQES